MCGTSVSSNILCTFSYLQHCRGATVKKLFGLTTAVAHSFVTTIN